MEGDVDALYLKGFNNGYLLAKHEPELAAKLMVQPNDQNVYFKALVAGKNEYEAESKAWAKSFSKGGGAKGDRGVDKER